MASSSKQIVSPLQITQAKTFKGLGESNYLTSAFGTNPTKLGTVMAFASGMRYQTVLPMLTGGLKNTVYVDDKEYQWDLESETERVIDVVADSPAIVTGTPGLHNSSFPIYLAEKFFDLNDNIVADDGTQLHIVAEGEQKGVNKVEYLVQHNEVDSEFFIDPDMISQGASFSKDYNTVAELSKRGGGISFTTPYKLRNILTTLRKTYEVSRNASKAVMVFEMTNPKDPKQKTKYWTTAMEWKAMGEWYKEMDRYMMYSKLNKEVGKSVPLKDGASRPIYHGAGLRQQIAPSNVRFYVKMTYKLLNDFLNELSYNATEAGGDYHFVALTGRMGLEQFSEAIKDYANSQGTTVTNSGTFITGSGTSLTLSGHYKTVEFATGVKLTVRHFPPYDDVSRHRTKHPVSGKPVESYRFTILNFGQYSDGNNIRRVALKDSLDAMWNVSGSTDPMGHVKKSTKTGGASGVDGFEVHYLSECGIQVQDPTSCGELILGIA